MCNIPRLKYTNAVKTISYELFTKLWEVGGVNIFSIDNKILLCIVGCTESYRKFPVMKRAYGLLADDLIRATYVLSTEIGLPIKIVLDAGTSFTSDSFKQLCRQLNIDQAITSLYHHQSNRQAEVCLKFVKHTTKCFDNINDVNFALLHIRSMPIGVGLPSPATLLLNRPIRALLYLF